MSEQGLQRAQQKMAEAGVAEQAINVFGDYYRQLEQGSTGFIAEDTIEPLTDPDLLSEVRIDPEQARQAIGQTVIIKLNGGLGTSMGLDRAKSLLPVRDGDTFLDLIARQVLAARKEYDARLPLIFMDSFRTREDTLELLRAYPELAVDDLGLDFLQNSEPKLRADDLTPVEWPAEPSLEWCPPGHGDLYPALAASGLLDRLLERGYRYASVSNSDNLGAAPNATIAGWFAASGAPYAAEVCRRTAADRKGGHLAIRKSDRRLILRDTAQTADAELDYFTDEHRHPFFHTNNLWFDLRVLASTLAERNGVLGLPMIKNEKTVDPTDSSSPKVIQLESAMGAAIEVFEGATAIGVDRERFLPVKTTNDLLLLRSDVYRVGDDGRLITTTSPVPLVDLDPAHYKTITDFDHRIQVIPSLREATRLTVRGGWNFTGPVRVIGDASLAGEGGDVPDVIGS
ncbi:UTP--glucose-1-phosphate uridylyltransferase [Microlunatus speluncae]|uniref:UTP--glucose-1-phosphate uridylyltransferase n=1 Tax=Microlunatus speluncae TaxID=2594267 RepID=UPI00126633D8|nr:UTP--glucose-1-phosphate uridylyltransferase [Microlunatus speluncae]